MPHLPGQPGRPQQLAALASIQHPPAHIRSDKAIGSSEAAGGDRARESEGEESYGREGCGC